MKPQDLKDPRKKTGISGLWLAVAAAAGAAIAYLGDPQRGNARRQAAAEQISGLTQTASKQTSRWRQLITARLGGKAEQKPPQQVAIPQDERSAVQPPSASKSTSTTSTKSASAASAEIDKPGSTTP
jgi:gas vesicle protein